jgi:hypothetical protein
MLVNIHQSTRRHLPDDSNLHNHRHDNFKSHRFLLNLFQINVLPLVKISILLPYKQWSEEGNLRCSDKGPWQWIHCARSQYKLSLQIFLYSCIIILYADTRNRWGHCNTLYTHIYGRDGEPWSKLRLTWWNITLSFLALSPSPPLPPAIVLCWRLQTSASTCTSPSIHIITSYHFCLCSFNIRTNKFPHIQGKFQPCWSIESRVVIHKNTKGST